MPRKKSLNPPLAKEAEDTILREPPIPLTLEDRIALRAAFTSSWFKKALHNARLCKPGANVRELNTALGSVIANNRLHEIRGWEMFEAALALQVADPALPKVKIVDDYPDAGAVVPPTPKKP
jgi:hypothetical protein